MELLFTILGVVLVGWSWGWLEEKLKFFKSPSYPVISDKSSVIDKFKNNDLLNLSIQHALFHLIYFHNDKKYQVFHNDLKKYVFAYATESYNKFSYVQWEKDLKNTRFSNLIIKQYLSLVGFRLICEETNGVNHLSITNHTANIDLIFFKIQIPNFIISFFSESYINEICFFLEKQLNTKIKKISLDEAKDMWPNELSEALADGI